MKHHSAYNEENVAWHGFKTTDSHKALSPTQTFKNIEECINKQLQQVSSQ
jgi:hypothetical protein